MLTEERYSVILKLVEEKGSITVNEIRDLLNVSEATVRRDLNALDKMGKLRKVFGGAVLLENGNYVNRDATVEEKKTINVEEKKRIARYAASLIDDDDFIYLDAGTTTGYMVNYVSEYAKDKNVSFATNSIVHALALSEAGFEVMVIGGNMKNSTKANVGAYAVASIKHLHFTKGFFGTNGITKEAGFTTPDGSEALTKEAAFYNCNKVYVLADGDKFGKISRVTFGDYRRATVVTDTVPETGFEDVNNIVCV